MVGVPGQSIGGFLRGRSNRRDYCLFLLPLFLAQLVLTNLPPIAGILLSAGVISVQVRRLHDFGRSGWWAGAGVLAAVLAAVAGYSVLGTEDDALFAGDVVTLIAAVWIGAIAGDAHANRFGPPPGRQGLGNIFD